MNEEEKKQVDELLNKIKEEFAIKEKLGIKKPKVKVDIKTGKIINPIKETE